jgi:hypothetical protein
MLSLTFFPFTSILWTFASPDQIKSSSVGRIYAHPKIHPDGSRRLILRQPLLVRETQEEAALPHRRVPDEEELDVDRVGHEDRRRKSSSGYMRAMGYVTLLVLRGDDERERRGRVWR